MADDAPKADGPRGADVSLELEGDAAGRRFGRGKLIASGIGAAVAALLGRGTAARADDVPQSQPLLLGTSNAASSTTSLLTDADGPALELIQKSGKSALVGSSFLPGQTTITRTLEGVALAGFGPTGGVLGATNPVSITETQQLGGRIGVLGQAMLPLLQPMTFVRVAGVGGIAPEHGLGVIGTSVRPLGGSITETQRLTTPTPGSGVAGIGVRSGVEGRTLLPDGATISITAKLGRGVAGLSSGLGVLGLSRQATFTLTDEMLAPAGMVGFGDRIGVWGGAGPALPTLHPITKTVGLLGTASGPDASAIVANNPTGIALEVLGAVAFQGGGTGTVLRESTMARVEDPAIHDDSLVNVTLQGDPGNAATVQYVEAGHGFLVVHLTVPPRQDTPFAYFVFHGR